MAYRFFNTKPDNHDGDATDTDDQFSERVDVQAGANETGSSGPLLFHKGGELLVWSLETYELLASIPAHRGAVLGLFVSQDGRLLFSSAGDAIVNVWCTQKLKRLYHIWSTYDVGDVFCVVYSAVLQTVYLGAQNTSIQWLDLSHHDSHLSANLESHPLNRQNKFFDSTGPGGISNPRSVLVAEILTQGGEIVEIDKEHIMQYAHFGYVYCMVLARGLADVAEGEETLISGGGDGTINLWRLGRDGGAQSIRREGTLENGDNSVLSMALDGTFLYSARLEGEVNVWDLDTRQLIRTVNAHNADVLTVSVGQDMIFTGCSNGSGKIFDRRYRCTNRWKAHDQLILASATTTFNSKAILVTGGNDDCVAIWDISTSATKPDVTLRTSNEELLESLRKFVSFRTVSSKLEYNLDCRRGASWLRSLFKRFGASTEMFNTDDGRNPIVFARFKRNESGRNTNDTVLFYGHYDVIPAENEHQKWIVAPFDMQGIDGYLYGRGTSDNKGPLLAALYAVADLVAEKKLAADVVFLIEGEEESGSRGFKETIRRNKSIIGDVGWIILANSYWLDDDIPCLTYGLRGVVRATIKVESKLPDLHSGVEGSHMMDEALKDLVMILAKVTGPNGLIKIPGFYDTILPVTEAEDRRYDAISRTLLHRYPEVGRPEDLIASFKAKWREPSLTMHGIKTSGPANSTIIPRIASAAISLRLVPEQDAFHIQEAFVDFLRTEFAQLHTFNELIITIDHQADPWLGDPENKIFKMLEKAIIEVWGPTHPRRRGSAVRSRNSISDTYNGITSPKLSPVTFSTRTLEDNNIAHFDETGVVDAHSKRPDKFSSQMSHKPLYIREGGTIPAIRFLEKEFGAQAAHLPCGQASDSAHLDNERFRLLNLYKSREIFTKVFSEKWS
ncbi:hypothetical protein MMC13_006429 [Lambiella insularis]|nr:hypothetical protein [Lambiella insularis]